MTPREEQLFLYLLERRDQLVQPTFQQMGDHLGIASKAGVFRMLASLERQGRIQRQRNVTRGVRAIPINPLAEFTTAELRQELARRGIYQPS